MATAPWSKVDTGERGAKPFLKWVGGKQQLLSQFQRFLPSEINRYLEPFVGGGALFFHMWDTGRLTGQTLLFDNNTELVNTYCVVRDDVEALIELLATHKQRHNKDYYYYIRGLDRLKAEFTPVERAARFIYLNKTCYNGLYRVNSLGQFNAPMGSYKDPRILNESVLQSASRALQGVAIEAQDFQCVTSIGQPGDFVYFDPPYDPVSKTASFTGYTAGNFGDVDQSTLARVFHELSVKGCLCMLSNSYTDFVRELYQGFRIEIVSARRAVNSRGNGRGSVEEVVILNY